MSPDLLQHSLAVSMLAILALTTALQGPSAPLRPAPAASRSALPSVQLILQEERVESAKACVISAVCGSIASAPVKASALLASGANGTLLFRIPVLLAVPNSSVLLLFAEARMPCSRSCGNRSDWGDSSPKQIAFRRSADGGKTALAATPHSPSGMRDVLLGHPGTLLGPRAYLVTGGVCCVAPLNPSCLTHSPQGCRGRRRRSS